MKLKKNLSTFFSKQAGRPDGLFGHMVMSVIFDLGNAFLNDLVEELMSVQKDDNIIEIGSGTGKLIYKMAQKIDRGFIKGVDLSSAMVSIARKRNKINIAKGKVKIVEGDFDKIPYENESYSKACSVNTLYFWPSPLHTARRIANILNSDGKFILAFEDIEQLKQRKLNQDFFHCYSKYEVQDLLINAGFINGVNIVSRKKGGLVFHCAVAIKSPHHGAP